MNWRLAESLKTLRKELDAAFPERSKVSDGSIGDAAHQSRKSDHDPNGAGVVTAIDVTNDIASLSGQTLADALYHSKDKRIKYLIWNKRITIQPFGSGWKDYHGTNAHQHHVHISVSSDAKLYDDASEWNLKFDAPAVTPANPPETTRTASSGSPNLLQKGDKGADVSAMQNKLVILGYLKESDGFFGDWTRKAVEAFQGDYELREDGLAGVNTLAKINEIYKEKTGKK